MKGLKQLLRSDMERIALERILDICISYGISVKQTYVNESHENMLDPPLNEVCVYTTNNIVKPKSKPLTNQPFASSTQQGTSSSLSEITNLMSESFKKILSSALHFEKLDRKFGKKDGIKVQDTSNVKPLPSPKNVSAQVAMEQKKR